MDWTSEGPLGPGARVGAFVVREEIGFGATSVVYEAEHRTLRHRVAVKVLRASTSMDRELRRRFEREVRVCASLASVHVPHVYDVGELPSGLPYIVMERLGGATLADWLAAHRTLAMPVAVEIGMQLCAALATLHEAGTVHRDVKPENVVLHREREGTYLVKLFDFGICKPLYEDGPALTKRGTVLGTPEYMSPEQVQGHELDARTDVYSTGVLLYELIAGRTPFEGRRDVAHAILVEKAPPLRTLAPECPGALESIVMRAIAHDREERYASMRELCADLERFSEERALRRPPRVWSLLPEGGPGRIAPLAQKRVDTGGTVRLPIERSIVTGAVLGLSILTAAVLSIGYYALEPRFAGAAVRREPSRHPAHVALPAPVPPEEEPAFEAPPPREAPAIAQPAPQPVLAPESPETAESGSPAMEAAAPEPAPRAGVRRRRRARSREFPAREPAPVTTIAVAPTAQHAPIPSAAEILAQINGPAPAAPPVEEPPPPAPHDERLARAEPPRARARHELVDPYPREIPPSPYDDEPTPPNPF
jgi:tRNA A-37 threonylcarbamoyl transferase component Bud32